LKNINKLKHEILNLLKEDLEFRYAVAGLIGLEEILKRLDKYGEILIKHTEEIIKLREDFKELREEQIKLREDFNRMFKAFDNRMNRIERTLEKLTLDIEDEAKEVIEGRLSKMGFDIKLERLELPDLELNLYGTNGNLCVIGEATVRLGLKEVEKLVKAVDKLIEERPDLLRPKKILALYTSLATEVALKEAEKEGIWVLKATKDLTKPPEA
jgi:sugar diacid utilization regulator